jgi:hypothetical protein
MRLRVIVPVVLASAFVLSACGSSGSPKAQPGTTPTTGGSSVSYIPAGVNPSISAKMICQADVRSELADTLGVKATSVSKPTWKDHVYSCTYTYPKGSFTLGVKELVDDKTTTAYFNLQQHNLGLKNKLFGLGQGAFVAKNDDVVVRKDWKVLVVDVTKVPKATGAFIPTMVRSDVATNIASVIMSCWQGT